MEDEITKDELTEFEVGIVRILRKKNIREMDYPGSVVIHFDSSRRPVSAERREIHS